MTPQEAQQAQTIKRIGEMLNTPWGHDVGVWVANCEDLLEIVDSQAQKIAQLTEERDEQTATAYRLGSEAQQHISEARKIAEKMRDASERPGGGHTLLPWEKQ